jgi:hypothetical protein
MTTSTNLISTIDAFGDLKADIAELEIKLQAMKDSLADLEKGAYEGERYRLNVIEANGERTDWKAICEKLRDSMESNASSIEDLNDVKKMWSGMRDDHTLKTLTRSYRVGARNGKKVA